MMVKLMRILNRVAGVLIYLPFIIFIPIGLIYTIGRLPLIHYLFFGLYFLICVTLVFYQYRINRFIIYLLVTFTALSIDYGSAELIDRNIINMYIEIPEVSLEVLFSANPNISFGVKSDNLTLESVKINLINGFYMVTYILSAGYEDIRSEEAD